MQTWQLRWHSCTMQAQRLTEFFLLPGRSFLHPRTDSHTPHTHDESATGQSDGPYDNEDDNFEDYGFGGGEDEGAGGLESGWGDGGGNEGEELVEAPHKVDKVAISYARASKQVRQLLCSCHLVLCDGDKIINL